MSMLDSMSHARKEHLFSEGYVPVELNITVMAKIDSPANIVRKLRGSIINEIEFDRLNSITTKLTADIKKPNQMELFANANDETESKS